MAHIAAVAIAWTSIERALVTLLHGVLGGAHFQTEDVVGFSGNWVARVAMEQAETIRTRIKLVDATMEPLLKGMELHGQWVAIRDQLQKRSRVRNAVVHANWSYAAELPGEVVRLRSNHQERWTIDDFAAVLREFQRLEQSIMTLMHDIGASRARGQLPDWPT